ncbi:MAG: hypothetical protein LBS40_04050 [Burkholderiales bacterium]|nr:hypothetical protein [Burkholderiales bacterium]
MSLSLIRLRHLASPALPVGAFSYSQGLEWEVEAGACATGRTPPTGSPFPSRA